MNREFYLEFFKGYMQQLGTANLDDFCPQNLSPILSLSVPSVVIGDRIGDKLVTKNVNDSDKG